MDRSRPDAMHPIPSLGRLWNQPRHTPSGLQGSSSQRKESTLARVLLSHATRSDYLLAILFLDS